MEASSPPTQPPQESRDSRNPQHSQESHDSHDSHNSHPSEPAQEPQPQNIEKSIQDRALRDANAPEQTLKQRSSTQYEIRLPMWSGPMDLLLDLIRSSELDIYLISISQITEDYLKTIEKMRQMDMEISSDFLVMGATLVLYKTRSLLGETDEFDEDSETYKEALIAQILAYEKYKKAAQQLEHLLDEAPSFTIEKTPFTERILTTTEQTAPPVEWHPVPLSQLVAAFYRIIDKQGQVLTEDSFSHFYEKIDEKIKIIMNLLKQPEALTTGIPLSQVAGETLKPRSRTHPDSNHPHKPQPIFYKSDLIASFIAVLELYKLARLEARQERTFTEIYLFNNEIRSQNNVSQVKVNHA